MKKQHLTLAIALTLGLGASTASANTLTQGYVYNYQTQNWEWQNVLVSNTYNARASEVVYQSPMYTTHNSYISSPRYETIPATSRITYTQPAPTYTHITTRTPASGTTYTQPITPSQTSGKYIWQNDPYTGGRWVYCRN